MAKRHGPTISVQVEAELAQSLDRHIDKLRASGHETDRSKHIRSLIRQELNAANSKRG
jgi:metal-responsive CopG/Arc/MetJ family transcriptional regulator